MKVLALNPGSASLKFEAIEVEPDDGRLSWGRKMARGVIEPVGQDARFRATGQDGRPLFDRRVGVDNHGDAAGQLFATIEEGAFSDGGLRAMDEIDLYACRVVHGGSRFHAPCQVDDDVLKGIEELDDLAPLHNASSVSIIRTCRHRIGESRPILAIFDSAFHATLPEVAYRYPIPMELSLRHGIRRYGFHGISHNYLLLRYCELRNIRVREANLITLHLEGGSSATAIRGGQSVDTSMGLTPLEGLAMGTRSGDIDPALVGYLARKEHVSISTVEDWLNHRSGLLGVSGISQDTRVLVKQNDARSQLALDIFAYRVRKYIGAYAAAMGGAHAVVFAGGIGENTPQVRRRICDGLEWLGLHLDREENEMVIDREGCISTGDSRLRAYVIPTEECLMMARESVRWRQTTAQSDRRSESTPESPLKF